MMNPEDVARFRATLGQEEGVVFDPLWAATQRGVHASDPAGRMKAQAEFHSLYTGSPPQARDRLMMQFLLFSSGFRP